MKYIFIMLVFAFLLVACDALAPVHVVHDDTSYGEENILYLSEQEERPSYFQSDDEPGNSNLYESLWDMLDVIGKDGYVMTSLNDYNETSDLSLLEDWIAAYEKGEKSKVVIFYNGMGWPNNIRVLESDGSNKYKITCYRQRSQKHKIEPPVVSIGTMVVAREFDYVFETGTREKSNPDFIVPRKILVENEDEVNYPDDLAAFLKDLSEYDLNSIPSLGVTTPEMAVQIVTTKYKLHGRQERFVIIGSTMISEYLCYVIVADIDGTEKIAVNVDGGNLIFFIGFEGGWFLDNDDNEVIIMPN